MRRNSVQTASLESDILKRVRSGSGISRVELARELGLSPSTAGVYVERLMERGFLTESAKVSREMGRPPKLLHLNPNGGEFIGVDFEARHITATAVDFADRPLRNVHKLIDEGDTVAAIIGKIQAAVLAVAPADRSRLLAIGVGAPGLVDSSRGIAVEYKYIPQWHQVPLAARLERKFKVPVFLENTMRAMALAELWFGQGRGFDNFLCVCIRSGIGVGMVLNGRLHVGGHYGAGELGRWRSQGGKGPELQDLASALSIQRSIQAGIAQGRKSALSGLGRAPTLEDVLKAAQGRDPLTLQVIGRAAEALGSALGRLTLAVDPMKIILAGHLAPLGDTFLQPLRASVAQTLEPAAAQMPEIVHSTMGEYIGALGAAALALHEWKPSR